MPGRRSPPDAVTKETKIGLYFPDATLSIINNTETAEVAREPREICDALIRIQAPAAFKNPTFEALVLTDAFTPSKYNFCPPPIKSCANDDTVLNFPPRFIIRHDDGQYAPQIMIGSQREI
jgi:hypothetical protein